MAFLVSDGACLLAQDENKPSRRERLMQRFDKDKDGKLDESEREAIRKLLSRSRQSGDDDLVKRDDKIHIPKDYDPKKKYPFILTLHGYTSNGRGQLKFFPMADLAEKYGFIYCAPDGIDNSWNATDACCDRRDKVDDSKYLRSLILKAMKEYNIDKKRVFVTGLSNGGFMSYRMAHDHSDLITAIVPFAGVGFDQWPNNPKTPVSVLHVHGTKDKTIKWAGGNIGGAKYPSAEDNFSKWKKFNACEKEVKVESTAIDLDRKVSGSETKTVRFESKDGKVVMELWEVVEGGHVTPPRSVARERIIKWMLARSK
ncbi:MAG: PHB depolymerase family esterase [Verrucomicrobiota bacterium]|nr:PHB depolymerase family esterase [Verrucomicrobiota bacterium]